MSGSQQLRGKKIFLSASIPNPKRSEKFHLVPDAQIQIEEAVTSLTRAILAEGGQLIFGGHPTISPLVGLVAGEYSLPRIIEEDRIRNEEMRANLLVEIFQSEVFREYLPDETWQLFKQGFATIKWTQRVNNERYNPEISDQPQCTESLMAMRRSMLKETRPTSMICIGGMEGVIEEAGLYKEMFPNQQIYVFESTGGAAQNLVNEMKGGVQAFDSNILNQIAELNYKGEESDTILRSEEPENNIKIIPYAIICQLLVQEIAEHLDS